MWVFFKRNPLKPADSVLPQDVAQHIQVGLSHGLLIPDIQTAIVHYPLRLEALDIVIELQEQAHRASQRLKALRAGAELRSVEHRVSAAASKRG